MNSDEKDERKKTPAGGRADGRGRPAGTNDDEDEEVNHPRRQKKATDKKKQPQKPALAPGAHIVCGDGSVAYEPGKKKLDGGGGAGSISLASASHREEDTSNAEGGHQQHHKTSAKSKKEEAGSAIPNLGMFAAVHQTQASRPVASGRRRAPDDEDEDVEDQDTPQVGAFRSEPSNVESGTSAASAYDSSRAITSSSEPTTITTQNSTANFGIPLAAEVADDDDNNNKPVFEASAVEDIVTTEEDTTPWYTKRRNQAILSLLILILIAIVVAIVILVVGGNSDDGGETSAAEDQQQGPDSRNVDDNATPVPSASPTTMAPTTFADRISSLVRAYSGDEVFQDESSPQSQGLQWITIDASSIDDISDDEILERYALAVLYFGNNGQRWPGVTNFLLPTSHCEWDAINCDSFGRPENITLVGENLQGSLPPEIGILSTLSILDMSDNLLTGPLPSEIGYLTNLKELILPGVQRDRSFLVPGRRLEDGLTIIGNKISGQMPSEIGLMTSLEVLELGGNELDGTLLTHIESLVNLRELLLENNNLQGTIPFQLGFLTSLQHLSLDRNNLGGGIPNVLCSSLSLIQELTSDCLASDLEEAEVSCKCCNICCDKNDECIDIDVTSAPSTDPSQAPTRIPSAHPSARPTTMPSAVPSIEPSNVPSFYPSPAPSPSGTRAPTVSPSTTPPTANPSSGPSGLPSSQPSVGPSPFPTTPQPTLFPTPTLPPTTTCSLDFSNSCIGNRACNGAVDLCTQGGSCTGRNACRSATNLDVAENSW